MGLHFREATSIYRKTLPFVLLRIGVGLLFGLAVIAYFGVVLYAGFRFAFSLTSTPSVSWLLLLVILGVSGYLFYRGWKLLSKYVFYMIKAGHIAVIAHVVDTGEVPDNQFSFGKDRVKEHFVESSALWAVDEVVRAVVEELNDEVRDWADKVPVDDPNVNKMIELFMKGVALATNYIDEAILAHLFVDESDDNWTAAKNGVVLYGKNWKPVLGSTLGIVFGMYAVAALGVMALTPLAGAISRASPMLETVYWAILGGLGGALYTGLLKPWVQTVVMVTFLRESEGQDPDSQTIQWIRERSPSFEDLMGKIDEQAGGAEDEAEPTPAEASTTA